MPWTATGVRYFGKGAAMPNDMWIDFSTYSRIQFQFLQDRLSDCSDVERAHILRVLRPAAQVALLALVSSIPSMSEDSTRLNGNVWRDVMDPWLDEGESALQEVLPDIPDIIGQIIRDLIDYFATGPVTAEEEVPYSEFLTDFAFYVLAKS